ncbi:sugar phosphate isomerase/epimerase family protein [Flavobacterium pallidum]|uniref:Xylose isomerase n=1 Tax=Flavobacterium pallidum TaxID=2172098 RepID=A0A2S1SGX7_9FLAO|nr:TIM barrel protein [Flavobacterium pallidum]AWI25602.1 xylose isomerase [Flavobacterium pallidum]
MNRRHFLKSATQFAMAVSAANLIYNEATDFLLTTEKPFFKLSLAQWSLHRAISENKTLNPLDFAVKAKSLGFEGLEYVSALYSLENSNENKTAAALAKELKLRSIDNGISNVLIMVDGEGELAALEKKDRDQAIDKHKKWIDAAAELECHSIRVNLFGEGAENDFKTWKETAVDGLGRLAEFAAGSKMNVIVENHGGLSSDIAKLTAVFKEINMKNCGALPDFGNFCVRRRDGDRWASPCVETYDKYKGVAEMMPFAKGVSAKSYDFDADGNETTIDYLNMLQIVKSAGYKGFIGVEYEGNRLNEIDGILATKKLLLDTAAKLR